MYLVTSTVTLEDLSLTTLKNILKLTFLKNTYTEVQRFSIGHLIYYNNLLSLLEIREFYCNK